MAVIDAYVKTAISDGRANPLYSGRMRPAVCIGTFEVAEADEDDSKYRLDRLPADAIITKVEIFNDAIAGATDYDLGFYKPINPVTGSGAVVSKDVLMDGENINGGNGVTSPANGLANVAVEKLHYRIFELLGLTRKTMLPEYDLVLTGNTVGTAAGTISYRIEYAYHV